MKKNNNAPKLNEKEILLPPEALKKVKMMEAQIAQMRGIERAFIEGVARAIGVAGKFEFIPERFVLIKKD